MTRDDYLNFDPPSRRAKGVEGGSGSGPSRHQLERTDDVLTYDTGTQIRSLHRQGQSIRQIARGLDVARNTVRERLRTAGPPQYGPRPARPLVVEPYRAYLAERPGRMS